MKLVVGLGNPGKEYANNRHNIGFIMLDNFCSEKNIGPWKMDKSFHAEIIKDGDIIFCKPQTYMNKSGEAVKKICDFYKITPENIIVIYDEIDLPTGKIQKKIGGSPAGHNGIKSLNYYLKIPDEKDIGETIGLKSKFKGLPLKEDLNIPIGLSSKRIGLQYNANKLFTKIRIGVDRPALKEQVVDWVLGDFSTAELDVLEKQKSAIYGFIADFMGE